MQNLLPFFSINSVVGILCGCFLLYHEKLGKMWSLNKPETFNITVNSRSAFKIRCLTNKTPRVQHEKRFQETKKKVCKNPDISNTVCHDKRWRCKDIDKSYLRGIQHVLGETIPSNQKIYLTLVCEEKDIYKGIHGNQNRNPKNKQDLMMRLLHITYKMLPQFKYIRIYI